MEIRLQELATYKKKYNKQIYGFDSFTGLSEDWIGFNETKGTFTRH